MVPGMSSHCLLGEVVRGLWAGGGLVVRGVSQGQALGKRHPSRVWLRGLVLQVDLLTWWLWLAAGGLGGVCVGALSQVITLEDENRAWFPKSTATKSPQPPEGSKLWLVKLHPGLPSPVLFLGSAAGHCLRPADLTLQPKGCLCQVKVHLATSEVRCALDVGPGVWGRAPGSLVY